VKGVPEMNKKLLIFKRKKAKELHEKGWSNRKIARHILASKNSVGKWVQMNESEILTDNRGWEKGKSREYTPETKQQIIKIRKDLEKEDSYFIGSKVVKENYEKQTGEKVSKSYVDGVLKEAGMVKSPEKRGIITRIEGQTTEETITALKEIWKTHPIPEIFKIDNDSAFGANLPHERHIGKLAFFLLNLGVYPL
jgi:transposase